MLQGQSDNMNQVQFINDRVDTLETEEIEYDCLEHDQMPFLEDQTQLNEKLLEKLAKLQSNEASLRHEISILETQNQAETEPQNTV